MLDSRSTAFDIHSAFASDLVILFSVPMFPRPGQGGIARRLLHACVQNVPVVNAIFLANHILSSQLLLQPALPPRANWMYIYLQTVVILHVMRIPVLHVVDILTVYATAAVA